jgi:hypothetical protein
MIILWVIILYTKTEFDYLLSQGENGNQKKVANQPTNGAISQTETSQTETWAIDDTETWAIELAGAGQLTTRAGHIGKTDVGDRAGGRGTIDDPSGPYRNDRRGQLSESAALNQRREPIENNPTTPAPNNAAAASVSGDAQRRGRRTGQNQYN